MREGIYTLWPSVDKADVPIPERLRPKRATKKDVEEYSALCDEIENRVVRGEDVAPLLAQWNARAHRAYEPWELDYFRAWLEVQFPDTNISDLVYWPNEWFKREEALQFEFTPQQFAFAAARQSGRRLPGAVEVELPFPLPPKKPVLLTPPP